MTTTRKRLRIGQLWQFTLYGNRKMVCRITALTPYVKDVVISIDKRPHSSFKSSFEVGTVGRTSYEDYQTDIERLGGVLLNDFIDYYKQIK